jgi:hypothetical protein
MILNKNGHVFLEHYKIFGLVEDSHGSEKNVHALLDNNKIFGLVEVLHDFE